MVYRHSLSLGTVSLRNTGNIYINYNAGMGQQYTRYYVNGSGASGSLVGGTFTP